MKAHVAGFCVLAVMLSLLAAACGADRHQPEGGLDLDFKVNDEATPGDAGLPRYPGAEAYEDDSDDSSSAANVRLSTPLFGFKVVAMRLETADKPQGVAAFYRRALSKYGHVLECSDDSRAEPGAARNDALTCDPNDPGEYSIVYKVGTEQNQRIVAIKPHGNGTRFSLVHLDMRDESK